MTAMRSVSLDCHIQQPPNFRLSLSLNLTASTSQQLDLTHLGVEFFATLLDALQFATQLLQCHLYARLF